MRLDDGQIEVLDDIMAEIFKKKTPTERLQIAFGMWHSARVQLVCYLRSLHPQWNEKQIEKTVAKRLSHGTI
ncbi:MAG: hypothetical protein ACUZ77_09155 [Candidatus Brocadiales bacterium]